MNKIINGKRYDTEKAKEIHCWQNAWDIRSVNYLEETLYRKRTGEFFLYTPCVSAKSAHRYCGNEMAHDGMRTIIVLSYDQAKEWMEENAAADQYEAVFGPVDEEAGNQPITLSLPAAAKARLKAMSSKTGETQSAIVAAMLGPSIEAGAEREIDMIGSKDGTHEAAQAVRLVHLSQGRIEELEGIRGVELYDRGWGECYEVVMLNVYQDDSRVELCHASVVGIFKTHAEASDYAAKKTASAMECNSTQCKQCSFFVRYHSLPIE